ncbi:MAG: CoA:oxalate CoA-transferase, partial [Kiritimatiellia bacterium]
MKGLRILDLTRVLAGPWAVQHLADQGADVIKVESVTGDETRAFGPVIDGASTYFLCANRNKRSIVLDLKSEAGTEVLQGLLGWADVLVENFRPGVADRLGFGWDDIRQQHPRLVYVAIHAFGDQDPTWRKRAGYDLLLQHMGG